MSSMLQVSRVGENIRANRANAIKILSGGLSLAALPSGQRALIDRKLLCKNLLSQAAGLPMSTVSQQLRMLRAENLVKRRRVAKHIYYALADHHITGLIRSALEHANEVPEESDE